MSCCDNPKLVYDKATGKEYCINCNAISYQMIHKGLKENIKVPNPLIEKYINQKLKILDVWIKKIRETFQMIDNAILLLQKQGEDIKANILLDKLADKKLELENIR